MGLKQSCNSSTSNCFEPCHAIPAGWLIEAKLISDPELQLLPVELLLVQPAVAGGIQLAAAGADRDLCRRFEMATVFHFKVTRQMAFPRLHFRKNMFYTLPAQGFVTLGTPDCSLMQVNTVHMCFELVFALELLYWIS